MSLSTDVAFFRLLADSYQRLVGKSLVQEGLSAAEG
ncbi:MEKHLA domain-containing protein, partial [Burkholderia pseudomallei]